MPLVPGRVVATLALLHALLDDVLDHELGNRALGAQHLHRVLRVVRVTAPGETPAGEFHRPDEAIAMPDCDRVDARLADAHDSPPSDGRAGRAVMPRAAKSGDGPRRVGHAGAASAWALTSPRSASLSRAPREYARNRAGAETV